MLDGIDKQLQGPLSSGIVAMDRNMESCSYLISKMKIGRFNTKKRRCLSVIGKDRGVLGNF